jgi:DNA-binding transcriptional LysR family regulator
MYPNLLDQLRVFRAVADHGTFTAAAEHLNKTVSTVSYAIGNLEAHLQVTLFDRSTYRPELTSAGREIYDDSEQLLRRVDRFASRIGLHRQGHKTRLALSVDTIFPRQVLVAALTRFSAEFPMISIGLQQRDPDAVLEETRTGVADLGLIRVDVRLNMRDIDGMQIGSTQNLVVMAPDHPLARSERPITLADLDDHRQIVLARQPQQRRDVQFSYHRSDNWSVSDDETLRALLKAGVGWAYVNRHVVAQDLAEGSLIAPDSGSIRESTMNRLAVIWRLSDPVSGPRQRLGVLLRDCFPPAYPDGLFDSFEQWGGDG